MRPHNLPGALTTSGAAIEFADRVISLINRCEIADVGEALISVDDLLADWALPHLDLQRDVLLVWSGDDIVAYADVPGWRTYCTVHPNLRGQGIGTAMLEWIEQRALERNPPDVDVRVGQTIPDGIEEAKAILTNHSYEPRHSSWILRFPGEAPVTSPPLPAGYEIRSYRPSEEPAVYQVVEDAFNEWPDRTPTTYQAWQTRTTHRVNFESELLLVAVYDEQVVGVLFAIDYLDEGWVDQLAVAAHHRGNGLAKALLARAFEIFKGRGQTNVGLSTDSRTGALDLYFGVGMEIDRSFTHYSKLLRPGAPTPIAAGHQVINT